MPKGHTNNPNGRPPKGRALADALAAELAHKAEYQGKQVTQRELMAQFRVHAALYGEVPRLGLDKEGQPLPAQPIAPEDRLALMDSISRHIDGPVQHVDMTSNGETIPVIFQFAERAAGGAPSAADGVPAE